MAFAIILAGTGVPTFAQYSYQPTYGQSGYAIPYGYGTAYQPSYAASPYPP